MTADPVRVVVVDDHDIVRDGLVALLGALPGVTVVGTAGDGAEAVRRVVETAPDVVVMDVSMPVLDGIEATRRITAQQPRTRVLMLTMNEDDETIVDAIGAGACGYLLKGAKATEVTHAIATAASGGLVFGASLAPRMASVLTARRPPERLPFPELTEREREVLGLMAQGRSNNEIASRLYVSSKTVRNVVSSIYTKLHASDRADVILRAREAGLG